MQVHVLQVESDFEQLTDSLLDSRKIELRLTVYFRTDAVLEEVIPTKSYYQGQVLYELAGDEERQGSHGGGQYYELHICAYDDINPAYDTVVKQLLGAELYDMLQLSWNEESIERALESGGFTFDDAQGARADVHQSRRAYVPPIAVGERILSTLLPPVR